MFELELHQSASRCRENKAETRPWQNLPRATQAHLFPCPGSCPSAICAVMRIDCAAHDVDVAEETALVCAVSGRHARETSPSAVGRVRCSESSVPKTMRHAYDFKAPASLQRCSCSRMRSTTGSLILSSSAAASFRHPAARSKRCRSAKQSPELNNAKP